ncbi:MAG: TolC family protein [Myxococcales bacterium]|nr:TolC family protein [Myxococcales bacterium]MCB9523344.1 TolC family protein [Myxococcales bacterium]
MKHSRAHQIRCGVALVAWWVALAASAAPPPAGPTVELDDMLRRVRQGNPAVDIARAKLADYQAQFTRAYYAWTPQLRVDSLLAPLPERRLLRECVVGTWPVAGQVDPALIGPCPGQNIEDDQRITADTEIGILIRTTARVTLPIYTFGKVEAGVQAARAGVEAGKAGVEVTQAELEVMVKQAYYGVQLAHTVLEVLEDGRKRMEAAKADIDKELEKESGRFTSNDLRKLIVQQADLEAGYLETEALAETAREGLRVAAGLRPGQAFQLDRKELQAVPIEDRPPEAYLELAYVSRPELRMADAGLRAQASLVDLEEANFWPDIALVGQFGFARGTSAEDSPDPFANDQFNFLSWGVVLGAEWRLDFANQFSKLHRAQASLAKARAQRDALRQQVRLDLTEKVGQMTRYRREVAVRESAVKASKAWLVSSTLNFGMGLASTDNLISALTAYSKARLSYYRAIYEYNLAVARLSRAVGAELALPADLEEPAPRPDAE